MRWAFFVDANLEPEVARILSDEGYRAEYSDYVLDEDADDGADILPYVRQEELIVITADVKNFAAFDESRHEGVFYLNQQRTSAYKIANAVLDLIDQYGAADNMLGKKILINGLDNRRFCPKRSFRRRRRPRSQRPRAVEFQEAGGKGIDPVRDRREARQRTRRLDPLSAARAGRIN